MKIYSTVIIFWSLIFLSFTNYFYIRQRDFSERKNHDTLLVSERCVIDIPFSERYIKHLDSVSDNERNAIALDDAYYSGIADSIIEQKNIKIISLSDEKYISFIKSDNHKETFIANTLWDSGYWKIFFKPDKEPLFFKGDLTANDLDKYFK